jgi:hypothetical protein
MATPDPASQPHPFQNVQKKIINDFFQLYESWTLPERDGQVRQ